MKKALILLASPLVAGLVAGGAIEFDESDISFHRRRGYDVVELSDCDFLEQVGEPLLPVKYVYVAIVPGRRVESVSVTHGPIVELKGEYHVYPCQPPRPLSKPDTTFVHPDPNVYASSEPYPSTIVELVGSGSLAGHCIASLRICPLRYIPASGQLFLVTNIDFRLVLTDDEHPERIVNRTFRAEEMYRTLVQRMVMNPEDVVESVAENVFEAPLLDGLIEYLIITDTLLVSVFQQLADWKTLKGVPSAVLSTSSIYAGYPGNDSQEMIRNCIDEYRTTHGTVWVLLGGDASVVPYRGCYASIPGSPPTVDSTIPCDLYYSELDADWDANGNGVYGEVWDIGGNLYPDLWVGRAPVENIAEALTFVDKTLAYETDPQPDHTLRALFLAEFADGVTDFGIVKDTIDSQSIPFRFEPITKLYESSGNLNKSAAVSEMNSGYNLINHAGHGMTTGMCIGSDFLLNADVHALTNAPRYSLLYSTGCYCGAFDEECVLEEFVGAPDGGGFSVGNSRYGWFASGEPGLGSSDRYERRFWYELFNNNRYRLGLAHGEAKAYYIASSSYNGGMRWCHFAINLLGDPEMPVWTDTPVTLQVGHPLWIPPGPVEYCVTVCDTQPVSEALVCLVKNDEIHATQLTDIDGVVTFPVDGSAGDTFRVTVTKQNCKPYQGLTPVVAKPIAHVNGTPVIGQLPLLVQFYVTIMVSGPYGADTLVNHEYIKVWDDSVWLTDVVSGPVEEVSLNVLLSWSGGPYGMDSLVRADIPLQYDVDLLKVDTMIVGGDFMDWASTFWWNDSSGEMSISVDREGRSAKPEGIYHVAEIELRVQNCVPPETTYIDVLSGLPQDLGLLDQNSVSILPDFNRGIVQIFGFACGDCNADGRVTVADATYTVSHIYRAGPAPSGSGDVNMDGHVTVADVIYTCSYIYREGPSPCAGF